MYLRVYRATKARRKDGKEDEDTVFSRSGERPSYTPFRGEGGGSEDSVRKGGRYIEGEKIGVGQKKIHICTYRESVGGKERERESKLAEKAKRGRPSGGGGRGRGRARWATSCRATIASPIDP